MFPEGEGGVTTKKVRNEHIFFPPVKEGDRGGPPLSLAMVQLGKREKKGGKLGARRC